MVVFVEASVLEEPALTRDSRFIKIRDRLHTFKDGTDLQVTILISTRYLIKFINFVLVLIESNHIIKISNCINFNITIWTNIDKSFGNLSNFQQIYLSFSLY